MSKTIQRKWGAINLVLLYVKSSEKNWEKTMQECLEYGDAYRLQKLLYGIQAGMDDLVKHKLDTEKMHVFFIWLQRSLEKTAKKIFLHMYPSPLDNPTKAITMKKFDPVEYQRWLKIKKKRDLEFEKWRKGASY